MIGARFSSVLFRTRCAVLKPRAMDPRVENDHVRGIESEATEGDVNALVAAIGNTGRGVEIETGSVTENGIARENGIGTATGNATTVSLIHAKDPAAGREIVNGKGTASIESEAEKKVRHVSQPGQELKKNRQRRLPSHLPRRLGIMTIATESVNETEIENENQAEDHPKEKENRSANVNENEKEIAVTKEETLRIVRDTKTKRNKQKINQTDSISIDI